MTGNNYNASENNFHFGTYILYSIFDWLKCFGFNPNWKSMKRYDQLRD